jgi:hypothetical protein
MHHMLNRLEQHSKKSTKVALDPRFPLSVRHPKFEAMTLESVLSSEIRLCGTFVERSKSGHAG